MTEQEIIEGDFKISNFVGFDYPDSNNDVFRANLHYLHNYHKDWNLLMPVVEKISKIEIKDCPVISNGEDSFFDSYYPRTFGMISSETKEFMVRINRFPLHHSNSFIEAAWMAVIDFIQWYNTQTPTK